MNDRIQCQCMSSDGSNACKCTASSLIYVKNRGLLRVCGTCMDNCFVFEQHVKHPDTDDIECSCGNTPDYEGFAPCCADGLWCDDTETIRRYPEIPWDGIHLRCAKCDFVIEVPNGLSDESQEV